MRFSLALLALLCSAVLVVGAIPITLQDQEDVRGAFLTSRPKEKTTPKSSTTTAKPSRRKPKVVAAGPEIKGPVATVEPKNPKNGTKGTRPSPVNVQRMGLGLTLFMRDANGLAVRTDPNRVFRKGDRVRVLLETNTDGYLYIFNTTNDGPPVMIYPDADLDEGGNYLMSHVPFEIPSSLAAEERLRWFAFDDAAGDEKLYFVFTKEPLGGLPIDDQLIALCQSSKSACPVKPTADVWLQIEQELKQPLQTDRVAKLGQTETPVEKQATTRGLGLAKDDPQPTMIMMASSRTARLVTTLDLIHKD
jgi:hypothetical protein